jgi:exodeoxyribonuclease-3
MRILSWNVNGLRAVHKKGFLEWLAHAHADVVGLQEVRAREDQLPEELRAPRVGKTSLFASFSAAERAGYSGVGLYSHARPDAVTTSLSVPEFDVEGRFQCAEFGRLLVCNVYFPNGNGKERDNSRIPYKLDFTRRVHRLLEDEKRAGRPILVMGDFNTARQEIDLARPKDNEGTSGFTPVERAELDAWVDSGWVDTFRAFERRGGHYTWWSQRFGVRERNVGWRIDYVFASPGAMPFVRRAFHQPEVMGSDHCPVGVELDDAVMR